MSVAELLTKIQILTRAERLRLVRDIIASLQVEEELLETPAPWERDPRVMARLLESIAQSKAGQRVEATLETPIEESAVTMKDDSTIKSDYDFKTLRKADAARHRAILARDASSAAVRQEDGSVTVVALDTGVTPVLWTRAVSSRSALLELGWTQKL